MRLAICCHARARDMMPSGLLHYARARDMRACTKESHIARARDMRGRCPCKITLLMLLRTRTRHESRSRIDYQTRYRESHYARARDMRVLCQRCHSTLHWDVTLRTRTRRDMRVPNSWIAWWIVLASCHANHDNLHVTLRTRTRRERTYD